MNLRTSQPMNLSGTNMLTAGLASLATGLVAVVALAGSPAMAASTPADAAIVAADAPDAFAGQANEVVSESELAAQERRRRGGRRGGPAGGPGGGDGGGGDDAAKPDAADDTAKKDEEAAEELPKLEDAFFAITGGTVHTVSGPVLDGATILCRDGKIERIGRTVKIPAGAEVIDASGMHVYPGLIAVKSGGVLGGGNPADSSDVFGFNMTLALAAGITTSTSGTSAAKLTFGTLDHHTLTTGLYTTLRYDSTDPRGRRRIRANMERVRTYLRDKKNYDLNNQRDPDLKEPDGRFLRGEFANYRRLIEGDAVARVNATDVHGILQICDLAEDFGFKVVFDGATEAWIVADRLGQAGASVILSPRDVRPPNETLVRENGSSIQNARILRDAGVPVAVTPAGSLFGPGDRISLGGLAGRDLLHLPMAAAFAVRGGLTNDEGIRTITLDAARVLGIDHRVGSIEVGKDADFVIVDGDLLHYMTLVQKTIVNGRVAYDKEEDSLFSHIRPAADPEAVPPDDYWPRRLGDAP
ncbi:MAG: amidohydrolase family protein [Phycisphaerales bacterium]